MRTYITSRGRTGVSFGFFGTIVMAFVYLVAATFALMAIAVVALVSALTTAYRRHKGTAPSQLPLPPDRGETAAFFDSSGRLVTGRFVNKRPDGSGRVTFDWRPDPDVHLGN